MSASFDALTIGKSIRHTFCEGRHLSWLCADKNGALIMKQNSCRLFYWEGMTLSPLLPM